MRQPINDIAEGSPTRYVWPGRHVLEREYEVDCLGDTADPRPNPSPTKIGAAAAVVVGLVGMDLAGPIAPPPCGHIPVHEEFP